MAEKDLYDKTEEFLETDTGKATQDAAFAIAGGMVLGPLGAAIGVVISNAIRDDGKPKTSQPSPGRERGGR